MGYWHQEAWHKAWQPSLQGNQEPLVIKDKDGKPHVSLAWASPWSMILFPSVLSHCWFGDRNGIRPVNSWVLVCWWWQVGSSFARLIAPVIVVVRWHTRQRSLRETFLLRDGLGWFERESWFRNMSVDPKRWSWVVASAGQDSQHRDNSCLPYPFCMLQLSSPPASFLASVVLNGVILVSPYLSCPGKWPLNERRRRRLTVVIILLACC